MNHRYNRRQFLTGAAGLGAAGLVSNQALGQESTGRIALPKVTHSVFFWLKNPDSQEDRDALIRGLKTLEAIPTVRAIHVGVPAREEKREVVDNSYDVSELLLFDDLEGEAAYQVHPIHQKFVEDYAPLWREVRVFDSTRV